MIVCCATTSLAAGKKEDYWDKEAQRAGRAIDTINKATGMVPDSRVEERMKRDNAIAREVDKELERQEKGKDSSSKGTSSRDRDTSSSDKGSSSSSDDKCVIA